MRIGVGIKLRDIPILASGAGGAFIALSGDTIAENSAAGSDVGVLSVVSGSCVYTFSITADPDAKFALNVDGVTLEVDAAIDYETATSHSVTISADNGVDPVISRVFTINVTDVADSSSVLLLVAGGSDSMLLVDGSSELLLAA